MVITSLENAKIKELVKLKTKKERDLKEVFLVDTVNLILEAYQEGLLLEVYKLEDFNIDINVQIYDVTLNVMNKIKTVETTKIVGVVKKKKNNKLKGTKILLLDGIQDPGNLGTIIRSCLGFNVDTVVLSNDCVDLYNDKTIRATEGSLFKVNVIRNNLKNVIEEIKSLGIPIYKTDVKDGTDVIDISKEKYAIVMGSEGNGISKNVSNLINESIHIKTNSNLESLNVAIATSIILYELSK